MLLPIIFISIFVPRILGSSAFWIFRGSACHSQTQKKGSRSDSRFTSSFKIEDLLPLDLLRAVCYTARSIRELLRGFPKPAR